MHLPDITEPHFPNFIKFGISHGSFLASGGILTSLVGFPQTVKGDFNCNHNELQNFIGGPTYVEGEYIAACNPLISMQGLPRYIGGDLFLSIEHKKHFSPQLIRRISSIQGQINYS